MNFRKSNIMNYKYIIMEDGVDVRCNTFREVVENLIDPNYYSLTDNQKKSAIKRKAMFNYLNQIGQESKPPIVTDDEYTYIFSLLRSDIVHLLERMDGRELTKDIDITGDGNYVHVNCYAQELLDNYQVQKIKMKVSVNKMAFLLRENMPNAYKEVNEILKYVRKEDRDAIPNDFMEIIERKMNKEYRYIYDYTKSFEEQVMLQETKAILGYIYLNFWANEEERRIVNNKLKEDIRIWEEEKAKNFDPKTIFKHDEPIIEKAQETKIVEETGLIEVKDSLLKRIINRVKAFFHK